MKNHKKNNQKSSIIYNYIDKDEQIVKKILKHLMNC